MYDIGGVYVVLKELYKGGYIHGDCLTITGKTMAQNLAEFETIEKEIDGQIFVFAKNAERLNRATADFPIGSRRRTVWQGRSW
jgi:dihydroxyacid dehydratase/phosphogluconate dehydratase